ncbi:phage integrase family protein [Rhodopseudomonas faecalis]|uniref:Phage integrase family protein n=2 Tax=Rhodopseudomonas faecalis TaxID=99655 RepID=A0A318TJL6_9BRAD|nr:phage integrase family protein [Rhodopseudomonas faecalis]
MAYLAKIAIMKDGKAFRQSRTFDRRQAAAEWIAKREKELAKPGALAAAALTEGRLTDAIERYISTSVKKIGRTKIATLRVIQKHRIAKMQCRDIDSAVIVEYAQELLTTGSRQPQTVGNYLSHLQSVFAIARPAWKFELDPQAMVDAIKVLKRLGAISRSRERDRRPTLDELDVLMRYFVKCSERLPDKAPMHKIVPFALFSTRRLDEIARAKWEDLDVEGSRMLVRDMKNPGEKIGNDTWCDLPPEALRIALSMPRTSEYIFAPVNKVQSRSISAAFTRAGIFTGVNNIDMPDEQRLHFHDLRHEGISRLFELGRNIPQAAAVSGHRSWTSLKRYAHIRQTGDKWAGWKWLDIVCTPDREKVSPLAASRPRLRAV